MTLTHLGLGGGCHWCTEAIFNSLKGMHKVKQGWLSSTPPNHTPSEGVLLTFDEEIISLQDLITIHIETHSATAKHSMRSKYRSAIYAKEPALLNRITHLILLTNAELNQPIITQSLELVDFKIQPNEAYQHYFYKRPDKPFCQTYISPKLKHLLRNHAHHLAEDKRTIIEDMTTS